MAAVIETVINHRSYLGTIFGNLITGEAHTIPSAAENGYYFIQLNEVPGSRPDVQANITISGFTETTGVSPTVNKFIVDYNNGRVYFHSSAAGQSITADYYGIGTVIRAEEVNGRVNKLAHAILGSNNTGSTIERFKVVKVAGYNQSENIPYITPITATDDQPYGVVATAMETGTSGDIIVKGMIRGVDTSAGSINSTVYFDSSGTLTLVEGTNTAIGVVGSVSTYGTVIIGGFGAGGGGTGEGINATLQTYLNLQSRLTWGGM